MPWGHRRLGETNKIITCELLNRMVFWILQVIIHLKDIKQLDFFFLILKRQHFVSNRELEISGAMGYSTVRAKNITIR